LIHLAMENEVQRRLQMKINNRQWY
jgi:hypothetical protein